MYMYICMIKIHLNLLFLQFKVSFSLVPEQKGADLPEFLCHVYISKLISN